MDFNSIEDNLRIELKSGESIYAESKYVATKSDSVVETKKKGEGILTNFRLLMWPGGRRVGNPILLEATGDGYMELSGIHGGNILKVTLADSEQLVLVRGDTFLACTKSIKFDVYQFVLGGVILQEMYKWEAEGGHPSAHFITRLIGPGTLFLRLSSKGQVSSTGDMASGDIEFDKLVGFDPNLQHEMSLPAILEAKKEGRSPIMKFEGMGNIIYTSDPIPGKL